MKRSKFIGRRMAEFQFGKIIFGFFQFAWFMPVYFKMFRLTILQTFCMALCIGFFIWVVGFLAYRFGIVKHFKRREFKGVLQMGDKRGELSNWNMISTIRKIFIDPKSLNG